VKNFSHQHIVTDRTMPILSVTKLWSDEMGRPPIGKHAMSGAERQRRYLAKLLDGKPSVTKPDNAKEIVALKAHNTELEEELAELEEKLVLATKTALELHAVLFCVLEDDSEDGGEIGA
jgi:hypothetical protein